jgi:malic enzyme
MPVMEGKGILYKYLGGVDAYPICLDEKDPDKIIEIGRALQPSFGGYNLEDIAAPKCFDVEEALQDIGIPVMHDDQHGTAIISGAALLNALLLQCAILTAPPVERQRRAHHHRQQVFGLGLAATHVLHAESEVRQVVAFRQRGIAARRRQTECRHACARTILLNHRQQAVIGHVHRMILQRRRAAWFVFQSESRNRC